MGNEFQWEERNVGRMKKRGKKGFLRRGIRKRHRMSKVRKREEDELWILHLRPFFLLLLSYTHQVLSLSLSGLLFPSFSFCPSHLFSVKKKREGTERLSIVNLMQFCSRLLRTTLLFSIFLSFSLSLKNRAFFFTDNSFRSNKMYPLSAASSVSFSLQENPFYDDCRLGGSRKEGRISKEENCIEKRMTRLRKKRKE